MEKVRLDKYLAKVLGVPRAQIAHLIDKKMVLVNGVVAKKSEIIEESDKVEIAESSAGNSVLGMQFRTCENFRTSTDSSLVESPKISTNTKATPQSLPLRFCESQNLRENQAKIAEFANKSQQTIEGIAVEVVGFLDDFGRKARLKSAQCPKSSKSTQDAPKSKLPQEEFALQIQRIYEDDDILIINKPPFLATHGAPSLKEPSLVEWLKAHKIQRSTISGELREGIVHRLDKQTSGALVVAKNNDAHNALSAQLADKTMGRLYLAIIDLPLKEDIEIECYLARNPKNRLKISKVDMRKYKKFAETQKELCEAPENSPASWCKKSGEASSSASTDFLLEADKRGSPPKSEKRQLLARRGSGAGGAALLREKKDSNENAESVRDLQSGLPRAINCARNDEFIKDSSPTAQNDKVKNSQNLPKFARYSKSKFYKLLPSKDGKKELILAKLFTGRTHQIRAHLESINRHIVGDELYGYKRGRGEGERVMLHAYLLELAHPKGIKFAEFSVGNSSLGLHSADFGIFGDFADFSPVSAPKIPKNHESQTENPSVVDSARNAQNLGENQTKIAESSLDSANPKLRFIAPLFDDMKDYLAKNFDMEKVYEILHGLPARAF